MSAAIDIDTRDFDAALKDYYRASEKALPEIINQRLFNVAARTMDGLPPAPGDEQKTRSKIKAYLTQAITTRLGRTKGGKFKRKGRKSDQLTRVNLIVQARRAKAGQKGLYGQAMRRASTSFKIRAQVGVGFLKSPFIPVIKGLIGIVKYRKVNTRWGRISVWPGSRGHGKVDPAKTGLNPEGVFNVSWGLGPSSGQASTLVGNALQKAFDSETAEIRRHMEERLQKEADKVNG